MARRAVSIHCDSVGVAFTRGSRRFMLRKSLKRALFRSGAKANADDDPSTFWALRGVSFSMGPGTILGLCGGNGAGKTTLLRSISGIYSPDEGRVHVQGRTSVLLSLGAMLSANHSGRYNVKLASALHGIPAGRSEDHLQQVQDFAELDDDTMDTPVCYYSAGMRARLAFASASVLEPEILLVDELLGVGDAAFRKKSSDRLIELTAASSCVILASHSTPFLKSLCNRALWLDGGRLVAQGPADEVLDAYSRRVTGLAAGVPMEPLSDVPASADARRTTPPAETPPDPPVGAGSSARR